MTRDDIIRMAREAGLKFPSETELSPQEKKFAELVIAAEREACANVVEQAGIDGYGTLAAAAIIRARGET